jgi:hypothetical protein
MKTFPLYIPTTIRDLLRRSAIRIGCCALPYTVIAWLWSLYRDDRLFYGVHFFWCVVLIPGAGLALDVWRLQHRPAVGGPTGEPGASPNGGPATRPGDSAVTDGPPGATAGLSSSAFGGSISK